MLRLLAKECSIYFFSITNVCSYCTCIYDLAQLEEVWAKFTEEVIPYASEPRILI